MLIKTRLYYVVVALILMFVHFDSEARSLDCKQEVEDFLQKPTRNSLALISGEYDHKCWLQIDPSNYIKQGIINFQYMNKLVELAKKGNKYVIVYLLRQVNLGRLDGGELEDVYRALGVSADNQSGMEQLLLYKRDQLMSSGTFASSLIMLPLSYVDDFSAQITELQKRKQLIENVSNESLTNEKAVGIKILDDELKSFSTINY